MKFASQRGRGWHLGLALHKGIEEGGEGKVAQGVAIVDHGGARQQLARHGGHAWVAVRRQRHQLPPRHPLRPRVQRLPANAAVVLTPDSPHKNAPLGTSSGCCPGQALHAALPSIAHSVSADPMLELLLGFLNSAMGMPVLLEKSLCMHEEALEALVHT